ncbi:MAG: glycosyltransferase [Acidimicrobiales bacterium]
MVVAVALGYRHSLGSLLGWVEGIEPYPHLALVPLAGLVLFVSRAPTPADETPIYDRQLDYIVGTPLLVGAIVAMAFFPADAGLREWGLDLLTLPLFAAGAVGIVLGVRALWRLAPTLGFWCLAWPPLYELLATMVSSAATASTGLVYGVLSAVLPWDRPGIDLDSLTGTGFGGVELDVPVALVVVGVALAVGSCRRPSRWLLGVAASLGVACLASLLVVTTSSLLIGAAGEEALGGPLDALIGLLALAGALSLMWWTWRSGRALAEAHDPGEAGVGSPRPVPHPSLAAGLILAAALAVAMAAPASGTGPLDLAGGSPATEGFSPETGVAQSAGPTLPRAPVPWDIVAALVALGALAVVRFTVADLRQPGRKRRARGNGPSLPALPPDVEDLPELPAHLSARQTFSPGTVRVFVVVGISFALLLVGAQRATMIGLAGLSTVLYVLTVGYRVLIFRQSVRQPTLVTITDDHARSIPDGELPLYTVLIAAYKEPEVIGHLITAVDALEYPRSRLEVKLLLEADDEETIAAAVAARPGPHIEIVAVPVSDPRTKPKALNYGLRRSRGELLTIFDAEDLPEPLQLRKAAVAFSLAPDSLACLQAKLAYHNSSQNIITRWFTAEYASWFSWFLPGLLAMGAPLPLGGTSNHFRRSVLEEVGAWDSYNVTEDADLGIRLQRSGWKCAILDSVTLEEANSDFVNWSRQRSRWLKGYMQTWLVHSRHPRQLYRDLGPRGFLGFHLFVGGTPILSLVNPVFWALTLVWMTGQPEFIQDMFPLALYYTAFACWALGNFSIVYINLIAVRTNGIPELALAALLEPVYWIMISMAGVKAVVQLVSRPSFWEKTEHGLIRKDEPAPRSELAGA